jgi:hypothetical protein
MDDDFAVLKKMEEMKKKKSRSFDSVLNKKKYDRNEADDFFLGE